MLAADERVAAAPSLIVLYHIEKTAGTSVFSWLTQHSDLNFDYGRTHCFFRLHLDLFPEFRQRRCNSTQQLAGAWRRMRVCVEFHGWSTDKFWTALVPRIDALRERYASAGGSVVTVLISREPTAQVLSTYKMWPPYLKGFDANGAKKWTLMRLPVWLRSRLLVGAATSNGGVFDEARTRRRSKSPLVAASGHRPAGLQAAHFPIGDFHPACRCKAAPCLGQRGATTAAIAASCAIGPPRADHGYLQACERGVELRRALERMLPAIFDVVGVTELVDKLLVGIRASDANLRRQNVPTRARHYQPIGKSTSRFYGVKAWNRQFDVDVANASVRALLERTVTCDRIVHDVASQLAQR